MWSHRATVSTVLLPLLLLVAISRPAVAEAVAEGVILYPLVPGPMCPQWSHLQCDNERCLRWEDRLDAENCSRVCVEPAPTCIHNSFVCDGVPDCEDGADEVQCVQCSLNAFPCDGVCRRRDIICDAAYSHCRPASVRCPGAPLTCPGQSGPGLNLTCDGVPDCAGGRDERSCTSPDDCQGDAFYCDGRCLRLSRRCDGVRHCEDGSDEANCPATLDKIAIIHKDGANTLLRKECFDCGNGRCVSPGVKCDGVDDCGNGVDEKRCLQPICQGGGGPNCIVTKCSEQGIPCFRGYRCGRRKWMCDGHPHCDGGSDEQVAVCRGPPKVFWCSDGTHAGPLPASKWCDGVVDCKNEEDEFDCPTDPPETSLYCKDNRTEFAYIKGGKAVDCPPPPTLLHCYDGTTRLQSTRCDGVPDCSGGEDEDSCSECYDGALLCDGRCVRPSRRCDGFFDCSDGSDERGCDDDGVLKAPFYHPQVCTPTRFDCGERHTCQDGSGVGTGASIFSKEKVCPKCIDRAYVCDGKPDCLNHADEVNCNECRGGSVMCGSRCVRHVSACPADKEVDACPGLAANMTTAATMTGVCDGWVDCADGRDEQNCDLEKCQGVFCDKQCRKLSLGCDGVKQCADGTDEAQCADRVVTEVRETWKKVGYKHEFTYTYISRYLHESRPMNITTVINETTAVVETRHDGKPPGPGARECPTTTTPEPTTTPELAPTPAPPLRGQRPRKKSEARRRQQQQRRARKQRKQNEDQHDQQQRRRRRRQRKHDGRRHHRGDA